MKRNIATLDAIAKHDWYNLPWQQESTAGWLKQVNEE
jgi:hypothetical protein